MADPYEKKDNEEKDTEAIQCIFSGEMMEAEDGSFYIDIPFEVFQQKEE